MAVPRRRARPHAPLTGIATKLTGIVTAGVESDSSC